MESEPINPPTEEISSEGTTTDEIEKWAATILNDPIFQTAVKDGTETKELFINGESKKITDNQHEQIRDSDYRLLGDFNYVVDSVESVAWKMDQERPEELDFRKQSKRGFGMPYLLFCVLASDPQGGTFESDYQWDSDTNKRHVLLRKLREEINRQSNLQNSSTEKPDISSTDLTNALNGLRNRIIRNYEDRFLLLKGFKVCYIRKI